MRGLSIDHAGIAVASIEQVGPLMERLTCAQPGPVIDVPTLGLRICFFGDLEVMEPTDADSPLGRLVAARGTHLSHVAWRVADLGSAMDELRTDGFTFLDDEPRVGVHGHRIVFLHPSSTDGLLVELVEKP